MRSLAATPLKNLRGGDRVMSMFTGSMGSLMNPYESDKKWGVSIGRDGYADWPGTILQIDWDNGKRSVQHHSAYDGILYIGR